MHEAGGHATGGRAFTQTLPVKMTDYLGGRTVKSQFGTQAPPSPIPQTPPHRSLEMPAHEPSGVSPPRVFKMYNH